jgi:hypothetical protein
MHGDFLPIVAGLFAVRPALRFIGLEHAGDAGLISRETPKKKMTFSVCVGSCSERFQASRK